MTKIEFLLTGPDYGDSLDAQMRALGYVRATTVVSTSVPSDLSGDDKTDATDTPKRRGRPPKVIDPTVTNTQRVGEALDGRPLPADDPRGQEEPELPLKADVVEDKPQIRKTPEDRKEPAVTHDDVRLVLGQFQRAGRVPEAVAIVEPLTVRENVANLAGLSVELLPALKAALEAKLASAPAAGVLG